jgi:phosphoribosylanthranilate isomerase
MVKVKICGFTNADDVRVACELGADMVGVILVPGSTRRVTIEQAKRILAATSEGVAKVAVIMPSDPSELDKFVHELEPDYLQIHMTFSEDELLKAKTRLGVRLIPVVAIPQKVTNYRQILKRAVEASRAADYLLLDTKGPGGGGTGLVHDWSLSRRIRETVNTPVFLAGGLNPSNVKKAIKAVRPHGVDVATGVESSPGKKDARLMREFIEAAKVV